jgi:hypothetical protein
VFSALPRYCFSRFPSCLAYSLAAVICFSAFPSPGEESKEAKDESVFDRPKQQTRFLSLQVRIRNAFALKDFPKAENLLREAIEISPHDAGSYYNLACSLALQNRLEAALEAISEAVALGFDDAGMMLSDPDLSALHRVARFSYLVHRLETGKSPRSQIPPPGVVAQPIDKGIARVSESNTRWDFRSQAFRTYFEFAAPPEDIETPTGMGVSRQLLRWWNLRGLAAGNHGDLYDNYDGAHSRPGTAQFPGLASITYSDEVMTRSLNIGLQRNFIHNAVTIGNSSTAQVGTAYWRSQPRAAYTTPGVPAFLYLQYRSNQLYVYPEHHDYDSGHNGEGGGYGDVYPAITPYLIISRGSSGSDRPFLEALFTTLAAFKPAVKEKLKQEGALMPTLQMILRMTNLDSKTREEYLTGAAHPPVFDGANLDVLSMIRKAQSIEQESLPPLVHLRVVEEDAMPITGEERLFDTPGAIARVFRTPSHSRRMVVSAEGSRDLRGKPLTYHWKLLRGKADRVTITPQNEEGSVAEITVSYHERFPVEPGADIETNRVDIGVFVSNKEHISAPAFISTYFFDHEIRTYDGENRLLVLDYTSELKKDNYVDPMIEPRKNWRDEFSYDEKGRITGWMRHTKDEALEFTARGHLIVSRDKKGRPLSLKRVKYHLEFGENLNQQPEVRMEFSDQVHDASTLELFP